MPGITPELFVKGVSSDPSLIKRINLRLEKRLVSAKEIKVFSPSGTNAYIRIEDSKFDFSDNGDASQPGSLINVPYGEVYSFISKCSGKIVIDRWQNSIKPNDNAIIELEDGKIVRWNNAASKYVMNQLNAGECGLSVSEFGIGTNPFITKPIGITLSDEKIFGSVHFAFGGGGKRKCGIHEDFVVLTPTVLVDGEELIKRGRFLFNIGRY
ncbi:MAG: aminopeptidase [Candidatus Micrarchaeota archaeon]|nr:aminopeptidase [Candidatus Micrarchaeota archaeon]